MIQQLCPIPSPDADPQQRPVCRNFLPNSEPCLLDSRLPPPWHCPLAVCPQRRPADPQTLSAWQQRVFPWQYPVVGEQQPHLIEQRMFAV